ncbi:MAG: hypothetical protein HEEMFOPI_01715 [Holosporales bacterium]
MKFKFLFVQAFLAWSAIKCIFGILRQTEEIRIFEKRQGTIFVLAKKRRTL